MKALIISCSVAFVFSACSAGREPSRVAVANLGNNTITIYGIHSGNLRDTISAGIDLPVSLAEDHKGNLFVANMGGNGKQDQGSITIYPAANYATETPSVITASISRPFGIALDSHDNLFVANYTSDEYGGDGQISEYRAGRYTASPVVTIPAHHPNCLVINQDDDLFVSDNGGITEYSPGNYTKPAQRITSGTNFDDSMAFSEKGDLYAASEYGNEYNGIVARYDSGNYSKLAADIHVPVSGNNSSSIALDHRNRLFVVDSSEAVSLANGGVSVYNLHHIESPQNVITNGLDDPNGIAATASGDIFVANAKGGPNGSGTLVKYDGGQYAGSAAMTVFLGINQPSVIFLLK